MQKHGNVHSVYFDDKNGLCYCDNSRTVKFIASDIVLFLDIELLLPAYENYIHMLSENGIKIFTFIHDLIPIRFRKYSTINVRRFKNFVDAALRLSDGIIANSNFVMNDIKDYIQQNSKIQTRQNISFSFTHLGSDCIKKNFSSDEKKDTKKRPIRFLMVSTISPRKRYPQAVKAFDILWRRNYDVTLTIVGRTVHENQKDAKVIRKNKQLNKKLFWFSQGISDEELQKLYESTDAVIFASEAEGFGLAITEAASYSKPLIIRNIAVFREVAENGAFYFDGFRPGELASAIESWISLYKKNEHPKTESINSISWTECAENIYKAIAGE